MDAEQFSKMVQSSLEKDRYEEIASLCIRYLKFEANDYGEQGKTAKKLLDIAAELINA